MAPTVQSDRKAQIVAWAVAGIFILGFFVDEISSLHRPDHGQLVHWHAETPPRIRLGCGHQHRSGPDLPLAENSAHRSHSSRPISGLAAACHCARYSALQPSIAWSALGCRDFLATITLPLAGAAVPWLALELHIPGASAPGFLTLSHFLVRGGGAVALELTSPAPQSSSSSRASRLWPPFICCVKWADATIPQIFLRLELPINSVGPTALAAFLLLAIWALFTPSAR